MRTGPTVLDTELVLELLGVLVVLVGGLVDVLVVLVPISLISVNTVRKIKP